MRKMWMIAALVLLALSVSGCANADYSEGTPSSEETVISKRIPAPIVISGRDMTMS